MDLKSILYIDDDINITKIAQLALEKIGKFDLTISHNGNDSIKLINENNFDLILLDVMMPEISGIDTLKKLKENKDFNTPVIFLTGKDDPDEIKELLSLGAISVINKPFNPMDLANNLKEIWNNK